MHERDDPLRQPFRGRWDRLRSAVDGTPLDSLVKWAIIAIGVVEVISFAASTLRSAWQTVWSLF